MKTGTVVALVAAAAVGLYLLMKRNAVAQQQLSLGSVGNAAHSRDITAGGIASVLGSAIPSLSKWFGGTSPSPASVPLDPNTPWNGNATWSNPVQSSPAVLPYSYKQQNIDTPGLLGTNDLFTPSTGSTGAYSDSNTNNGTDFSNVDYGLGG
jgi:hypothetical protein